MSLTHRFEVIRGVGARVDRRMKLWLMAALLSALPAAASDFAARYPAGSIHDAAAAKAALKDADAEMARIGQDAKARDAECYRRFLVNSCREDVRREKELAEREVKRVRLEANDLRRKLDAEQVAKRRAEEVTARAAEDAERARKAAASRAEYEAREAEVKHRQDEAKANGGTASKGAQSAPAPSKDRLTAAERAENARQYEEKQAQAAKRAQEVEARQKENEQRRAEKRKQTEQREAEREAVRKKAAEALK